MKLSLTTAMAALITAAAAAKDERTFAVLRFTNQGLTKGRMDPIVFPGEPSAHVHTVMGGSAFSLTSTGEELLKSNCSNAMVKGDYSNYWFPSLYFHDTTNNTFEPVEIFYVNVYYFFEPTHDDIKAFPVGLSMVSGNATTRVLPAAGVSANLDPSQGPINPARYTCPRLNNDYDPPSWPADSDGSMAGIGDPIVLGEGVGFPDMNCDGYASPLRADIHFPSCYNPKAGLTNYEENMVFPSDNEGYQDCPDGWIHVPHIFFEVYWNTPLFVDRWTQGQGTQPFVLSDGDATGYSSHGDFMAGWDEDLLQHIIDTCNAGDSGMDTCPGLFYGLNTDDCTIPSLIDEQVDGVLTSLPGNNPLQGWQYGVDGSSSGSGSGSGSGGKGSISSSSAAPTVSSKAAAVSSSSPAAASKTSGSDATSKASKPKTTSVEQSTGETAAAVATSTGPAAYPNPATESEAAEAISTTSAQGSSKPSKTVATLAGSSPTSKAKSTCKRKIHTVWETVTVTQSAPEPTAATGSRRAAAKREDMGRHLHGHARRQGSLHR